MEKYLLRVFLFYCLLFTIPAHGQQLILRNFARSDYNSGTQNWAVNQTADGRMLFANSRGLLTFDGDQWNTYYVSNYSDVRAILADHQHHIILAGATRELGYFCGDSKNYELTFHSLLPLLNAKDRDNTEVWDIYRWKGYAVFQNKLSIMLWNYGRTIKTVYAPYRIESSLAVGNHIVAACKEGIYLFDGHRFQMLPGTELLREKTVKAILLYHGQLLFATTTDGLYLYNHGKAIPYITDLTPILKEAQIFCAKIYKDYIAFGTIKNGLIVKNMRTGAISYTNTLSGLSNNTVLSIGFDKLGNIWLGLDNGLAYVPRSNPFYRLLSMNNNIGTGYSSIVMNHLLYLGTNQGLFVTRYPLNNIPKEQVVSHVPGMDGLIWCLRRSRNVLLCGSENGTFAILNGHVSKISTIEGTFNLLPLKHHPGFILGCDFYGFFVLQQQGNRVWLKNRLQGFGETSGGFHEDADGSIWVSHWQKGIYHLKLDKDLNRVVHQDYYHQGNGLLTNENNVVCKIGGRIYLSGVDGLRLYNAKTNRLEYDTVVTRIFKTYGQGLRIVETPHGDLWGIKGGYLALAKKQRNGSFVVDSVSFYAMVSHLQLGLGDINFIDPDHTIFNCEDGFYFVSQKDQPTKSYAKVMVSAIYSTNDKDTLLYAYFPTLPHKRLHISHSLNSLRMRFVMPEYRNPKAVFYSYYLEGYDKQWSAPQNVNSKEYTHLPKGKYTFHVRATNMLSNVTDETSVDLEILPPWYQTWWAYLLYALAVLLALRELILYLKRRADREVVRLKAEKERQLKEQQAQFQIEQAQKEKELAELKSDHLQVRLKQKASELADSTMNLIRKNEMLQDIDTSMDELSDSVKREEAKLVINKKIKDIRRGIQTNMNDDSNWKKFEENFNLVYDNFMQKLIDHFPDLKMGDRKLCAYLKMGLSSKEMAALLNTSVRSIETARYRLRKKLNMEQGENLTDFIQALDKKMEE
jgi:ligand-binding sensor domain-containing protein